MEHQKSTIRDIEIQDSYINEGYIFAGPLNFDMMNRQVSTVTGGEINLDANEFEALYILATNEDTYITIGQLCDVYRRKGAADNIDHVSAALENLMHKINQTGDGFMWIESTPEAGYKFKTRWGRKWNKTETVKTPAPVDVITPKNITNIKEHIRKPSSLQLTSLVIKGLGSIAAAIMIVLLLLYSAGIISTQKPEPILIEVDIEDQSVPLASPDKFE